MKQLCTYPSEIRICMRTIGWLDGEGHHFLGSSFKGRFLSVTIRSALDTDLEMCVSSLYGDHANLCIVLVLVYVLLK